MVTLKKIKEEKESKLSYQARFYLKNNNKNNQAFFFHFKF